MTNHNMSDARLEELDFLVRTGRAIKLTAENYEVLNGKFNMKCDDYYTLSELLCEGYANVIDIDAETNCADFMFSVDLNIYMSDKKVHRALCDQLYTIPMKREELIELNEIMGRLFTL